MGIRTLGALSALTAPALVGWIILQSNGRAAEPAAGDLTEQDAGRAVYQARCATCHGPHGEGTKGFEIPATGPALKGDGFIIASPESAIATVIRHGRTGARRHFNDTFPDMPSFDGSRIEDLRPLIHYLKGEMQEGK
jgi:mono/diheme cytochrome c family protein